MINKTISIIIDCTIPTFTSGIIADVIMKSITEHVSDNKNIVNDIEKINIKIYTEKIKPAQRDYWTSVPVGSKVFVADSGETLEDSILDAFLLSYCPEDEEPFLVVLCNDLTRSGKLNTRRFKHCKLHDTQKPKEPEIDWSKVPVGTEVFVNDFESCLGNKHSEKYFFQRHFPNLDCPFWVFNNGKKIAATGFKYCKLAEPMKPEWEKK